jgi:predicted lysophospholipase L1 biosynthesis ABC-type transport system permease subunit
VDAGGRATLRVVGTTTFPAIGVGGGDHVSLGRGALVTYRTLAELTAPGRTCGEQEEALCPQALVFDVAPGGDGAAIARHISAADPDGTPGGTYEQPVSRPADIKNSDEMGSFPLALATFLALAASIAYLVTLAAAVRARRRDLAVLQALGLTGTQIRASVVAQTLLTVGATVALGVPLGVLAGRLSWVRYATDIGVPTDPTVPLLLLLAISGAAVAGCAIVSLVPGNRAARTPAAELLRTE